MNKNIKSEMFSVSVPKDVYLTTIKEVIDCIQYKGSGDWSIQKIIESVTTAILNNRCIIANQEIKAIELNLDKVSHYEILSYLDELIAKLIITHEHIKELILICKKIALIILEDVSMQIDLYTNELSSLDIIELECVKFIDYRLHYIRTIIKRQ